MDRKQANRLRSEHGAQKLLIRLATCPDLALTGFDRGPHAYSVLSHMALMMGWKALLASFGWPETGRLHRQVPQWDGRQNT